MGPPGCQLQLYYGPTSHFSLVQHIYRCLNSESQAAEGSQHDGEVQEAGAGLDWASLSGIFFGTSGSEATAHDASTARKASSLASMAPLSALPAVRDQPIAFLSQGLANIFLNNFISSVYVLCPSSSEEKFRHNLNVLYQSGRSGTLADLDIFEYIHLLMALALGALASQHYHWGDIFYERAKSSILSLDEVVNLQMIQASLMMISPPNLRAPDGNEQGRPNSAFLHIGTATRKAVAAGLHKAPQRDSPNVGQDSFEAQNDTMWCLYFYETSISLSLYTELLKVVPCLEGFIGGSIDAIEMQSKQTPQQSVVLTVFNHAILLLFRPFVIFKGRWLKDRQFNIQPEVAIADVPVWLQKCCKSCLKAARRLIINFFNITVVHPQTQEFRYHVYFLCSASAILIYDFIFDRESAFQNLPYVYAALHTLSKMRHGDPIICAMKALQTTLKAVESAYEWNASSLPPSLETLMAIDHSLERTVAAPDDGKGLQGPKTDRTGSMASEQPPEQWTTPSGRTPSEHSMVPSRSTALQPQKIADFLNQPAESMTVTVAPVGAPQLAPSYPSAAEPFVQAMAGPTLVNTCQPLLDGTLPDFSASELGWDFSTMDLEAFFSIYPAQLHQA
ncbi:hypothetical protein KEM52_005621 [Ascosphaera acerosa]|nr:hypothetical protein KEM52_005621 [Ascosphaera acerosa]